MSTYLSGLLQSAKQIGEILKISMCVDGALDLIASYTFNLPPPARSEVPGLAKDGGKNLKMHDGKEENLLPVSTAEYNPCGLRAWLNNTTITLGMQNVFDEDPPFVAGQLRERLRRIACHDQRSVLVRPVEEEILSLSD